MPHSIQRLFALVSIAIFSLSACTVFEQDTPQLPIVALTSLVSPFGPKPVMVSPQELHYINPAQAQDFLSYFESPAHAQTPGYLRLADYIVRRVESFEYNADTLTAEQVLQSNSGNCLSLAIMTTALARLVGVRMNYQLMDDEPVFEFNGSTVVKGVHVRSKLMNSAWNQAKAPMNSPRGISIDYFPTGRARFISNLGEQDYYAMYYRNLAVESLQDNDFNSAYWLSMESLKYAPEHADALNMLAVIHRRIGRIEAAEQVYLYAIAQAEDKLALLKNYRLLLLSQNRLEEAQIIASRLASMEDPSPFNWYHLARDSYEEGAYERAISYYNKALELAPYLHEARLGIALCHYAMGRIDKADAALLAAIENANNNRSRQRYKEKLYALRDEVVKTTH